METPTTSPGLRERKKARTRAAIQREALRLFRAQGYAATSVEQIAAAAEVSPSTFFRYYPTKEDTVLADFVDEQTMAASSTLRPASTSSTPSPMRCGSASAGCHRRTCSSSGCATS